MTFATIEGVFDGNNMLGVDSRNYPVPANYASKSKLLEGDRLKLIIGDDGSFTFKQIKPTNAKRLRGVLIFDTNSRTYQVQTAQKNYNVLYASVTFFKAAEGDMATIIVPTAEDATWGALENIVKPGAKIDPTEVEFDDQR